MRHHGDLLGVDFWRRTQDHIRNGVPIHVFPYTPLSDLDGASSS